MTQAPQPAKRPCLSLALLKLEAGGWGWCLLATGHWLYPARAAGPCWGLLDWAGPGRACRPFCLAGGWIEGDEVSECLLVSVLPRLLF